MITYAIGDIHGRADLLKRAFSWMEQHIQLLGGQADIVFLGDYIDRGPASREVLDILMRKPPDWVRDQVCLMGNHEDFCLKSHQSQRDWDDWVMNGGDAALASFDGNIPAEYLEWMARLPLFHEDTHRIYVHAGMVPSVALSEQDPNDLLWIREPFLSARGIDQKHVVHGHTPIGPELLSNRTNLDGGACYTGELCVATFDPQKAGGPINLVQIGLRKVWTYQMVDVS